MKRPIVLFPGQGSQVPGMGKDVYDAFAEARDVFGEAEESIGVSLTRICFDLSPDELRETRNAQLALVVHGAAMFAILRSNDDAPAIAAAGHSVGEYAAFHASGALTLRDLVKMVDVRGRSMAESGRLQPGAMAALLGTLDVPVEDICREASTPDTIVVPANFNAPEQIVVSGHVEAVEKAMQIASQHGAKKVVRLNVSGAFHSPLMKSAQGELTEALRGTQFTDPSIPVYCNVTAEPCTSGSDGRELLIEQLASPVRWVELTRRMENDFPENVCLEVGPAVCWQGPFKRSAPSLRTMACGTAKDIDAIMKVLA